MNNDNILETIYEYLKAKSNLSDLEKDILDSIKEYNKKPVDKKALISRIRVNILKYNWLVQEETKVITASIISGAQPRFIPFENADNNQLLEKLFMQIIMMYSVLNQQSGYFMP